ncbi:MAG: SGNH/GDSL hydrolase family protein [Lachnospiraceae bacterium]|nr:SGNH/GDSL hydrolase family protein [Lachnospiraceae bacterium]
MKRRGSQTKWLSLLAVCCITFLVPQTALAAPVTKPDGTVFDAEYYADTYPDLKAAFGYDEARLWQHYQNYGRRENRRPCGDAVAFDPLYYAKTYPDLYNAFGTDAQMLWNHYRMFGKNEHRKASPLDGEGKYVYFAGTAVAPVAPTKAVRVALIGDSITSFAGTVPAGYPSYYPKGSLDSAEETWWYKTASALGMQLAVNASWNGSLLTGNASDQSGSVGCGDGRIAAVVNSSPDVVFILMGANDFIYNVPVGSFLPGQGPAADNTANFAGAYTRLIRELRTSLPSAKIVCLTCLPQFTADGRTMYNRSGLTIDAYNAQIRLVAREYGAQVIETAGIGMTNGNSAAYMLSNVNRIHPNAAGASLLADYVIANYR